MGNLSLAKLKQTLSQILARIQISQGTEKRQSKKTMKHRSVALRDVVLVSQLFRQGRVPHIPDKARRFSFYRAAKRTTLKSLVIDSNPAVVEVPLMLLFQSSGGLRS